MSADAPRPAKRACGADDDQRAFRVAVRGRDFTLSREQVLAEGANTFLVTALLGDWREGACDCLLRWLTTTGQERFVDLGPAHSPDLFAIVAEHMAGYEVVPLERAPTTMSVEQATRNLLVLARFLNLSRLETALERALNPPAFEVVLDEVVLDPAPWVKRDPSTAPEGSRMIRCRLRRIVFRCVLLIGQR